MTAAELYLPIDLFRQSLALTRVQVQDTLPARQPKSSRGIAESRAGLDAVGHRRPFRQRQVQAGAGGQSVFMHQLARLFEARHVRHDRATGTKAQVEGLYNGPIGWVVQPEIIGIDNESVSHGFHSGLGTFPRPA